MIWYYFGPKEWFWLNFELFTIRFYLVYLSKLWCVFKDSFIIFGVFPIDKTSLRACHFFIVWWAIFVVYPRTETSTIHCQNDVEEVLTPPRNSATVSNVQECLLLCAYLPKFMTYIYLTYLKSEKLQYNTLGRWVDFLNDQASDGPSIILIDWKKNSGLLAWT